MTLPLINPVTSLTSFSSHVKYLLRGVEGLRWHAHRVQNSACSLVSGGNCVPGWIYCFNSFIHTTWDCSQAKASSILKLPAQAKFSSQDVCFQIQSPQRCLTILPEINVINTFLVSASKFQKMCKNAAQKIFNCEDGINILKFPSGEKLPP